MKKKQRPSDVPAATARGTGWNTTDGQELESRRARAQEQAMRIVPQDDGIDPFYSDFRVFSATVRDHAYRVQIRSLDRHRNTCTCPDFVKSGLGHCKHIEAVLANLRRRGKRAFAAAAVAGSPFVDIIVVRDATGDAAIRAIWPQPPVTALSRRLSPFFSDSGLLLADPADAIPSLLRERNRMPENQRQRVRVGQDAIALADRLRARRDREADRAAWVADVAAGKRPASLVRNATLLDYQRDGALHMAFGGRVLLADEMGLGKTIQAIAACEILHQLRRIRRVLVVAPASLKTEWQEQIARFTDLPASLLYGPRAARLRAYREPAFFTIANYEQIVTDWREINDALRPDVVILDEAQRIKNWKTRTAAHIKRLTAPRAFVLTGTPVENRIDEIYSIVEFLDPTLFGSLFRFNRDFYELDSRGKPVAVCNLDELQRRLSGVMLRRRKADVEERLPNRTQKNYFVPMADEQRLRYGDYETQAQQLASIARRRPLTPQEQDKLQKLLACMRMVCDTPFILDPECRICPKLKELDALLDEILSEPDNKAIVFSEWVRMLDLVQERLQAQGIGHALHTGSIPQDKRRAEINRFKTDPGCRLFLSSDSGATGLNLQCANVVINLDLPWNPAKLEQRIARAWRKNQTRPVRIANLVTDNSIESRMLATLDLKRDIARGALDDATVTRIDLNRNRDDKLRRLNSLLGIDQAASPAAAEPTPGRKRSAEEAVRAFGEDFAARLGSRLKRIERVTGPKSAAGDVLLAIVDEATPETKSLGKDLLARNYADAAQPPPTIEFLDAATRDLLRRLTDAGLIQPGPGLRQTLIAAPDSDEAGLELRRNRQKQVDSLRQTAERTFAMAQLLGANGFESESVKPWREALHVSLQALRLLHRPLEETTDASAALPIEECLLLLKTLVGADADDLNAYRQLQETEEAFLSAPIEKIRKMILSALDARRLA